MACRGSSCDGPIDPATKWEHGGFPCRRPPPPPPPPPSPPPRDPAVRLLAVPLPAPLPAPPPLLLLPLLVLLPLPCAPIEFDIGSMPRKSSLFIGRPLKPVGDDVDELGRPSCRDDRSDVCDRAVASPVPGRQSIAGVLEVSSGLPVRARLSPSSRLVLPPSRPPRPPCPPRPRRSESWSPCSSKCSEYEVYGDQWRNDSELEWIAHHYSRTSLDSKTPRRRAKRKNRSRGYD